MLKKIVSAVFVAVFLLSSFSAVEGAEVVTSEIKLEDIKQDAKFKVSSELKQTYEAYKKNKKELSETSEVLAVVSAKKDIKKADFELKLPEVSSSYLKTASSLADLLLSVTASGGTPINYKSVNLPLELSSLQKDDGSFGTVDVHLRSMAALNASAAEYDKASATSFLLSKQNKDGSFGYIEGQSNIEATSMAITVLSDQLDDERVKEAVAKCVEYLHKEQLDNGGFRAYKSIDNSRTLAIVISSLLDAGENLDDESWKGIKQSLLRFKNEDGTYKYSLEDENEYNEYATTQVLQTLGDIKKGKSVYKRIGIFLVSGNNSRVLFETSLLCGSIIIVGIIFFIINKKRRKI